MACTLQQQHAMHLAQGGMPGGALPCAEEAPVAMLLAVEPAMQLPHCTGSCCCRRVSHIHEGAMLAGCVA